MKFKKYKDVLLNLLGWKSKRKIVVIESDDWGAIRSSYESYKSIVRLDKSFETDLYAKYDQIEGYGDLVQLYETLGKVKDINGKTPIITANTIVANPNFTKIKESKYESYHYELLPDTLNKVYPNENVFELFKEGINLGFIKPQFHGREHLNVFAWLNDLRNGQKLALKAFDHGVYGYNSNNGIRRNHMAAFDAKSEIELNFIEMSIKEGLSHFNDLFGFKSETMIAPCYVWGDHVENISKKNGVNAIQGIRIQYKPSKNSNKYARRFHYTGQHNKRNQIYFVRNAFFEPTHFGVDLSINSVLSSADNLFAIGCPLIIGSHRINYMGGIDSLNREQNLRGLELLIKTLLNKYPDIEFMTSDELYSLVHKHDK